MPFPKGGSRVQQQFMRKHDRIIHQGHNAGSAARPTRPGRIPPSWTGRTTCRPPMGTAWKQMTPRGSNWTNGDGSTSWTGTSSSSAAGPVTERMVAEACDTLTPGTPAQGDQGWPGETEILQEPPPPRRKTASTPRPE